MVILTVFIGLVTVFCIYIFTAPFYIEINTEQDLYRFRFHKLASVSLIFKEEPGLLLKIAGWQKEIKLMSSGSGNAVGASQKVAPAKERKRIRISFYQMVRVLKSFKVKTFYLDADFGDMPLNAILYPFFYWLGWHSGKTVRINFKGDNVLVLVVKNSIARMSWALIGSKLKTHPS